MEKFVSKIPAEGKEQLKKAVIAIVVVLTTAAMDTLFGE